MVGSAWTLFHLMISNLKVSIYLLPYVFCSIPSIFAGHNSHGIVPRNAGCDRALSRMCPLQVPKRSPWMVHIAVVFRSPLQRVFLTACGYAVKRTTFLQPEFDFLMGPSWAIMILFADHISFQTTLSICDLQLFTRLSKVMHDLPSRPGGWEIESLWISKVS